MEMIREIERAEREEAKVVKRAQKQHLRRLEREERERAKENISSLRESIADEEKRWADEVLGEHSMTSYSYRIQNAGHNKRASKSRKGSGPFKRRTSANDAKLKKLIGAYGNTSKILS